MLAWKILTKSPAAGLLLPSLLLLTIDIRLTRCYAASVSLEEKAKNLSPPKRQSRGTLEYSPRSRIFFDSRHLESIFNFLTYSTFENFECDGILRPLMRLNGILSVRFRIVRNRNAIVGICGACVQFLSTNFCKAIDTALFLFDGIQKPQ